VDKLLIFDFFSGTQSSTKAFRDAGHTVITFELDKSFEATENVSVLDLSAEYLLDKYGQPDFIWGSPPCTAFSVASIWHHWENGGAFPKPKTQVAVFNQTLVKHTIDLVNDLKPTYGYLIENPRGMLRKLPVVAEQNRYTITYCQYGDTRMKPTDLFGHVPEWKPRDMCKPKATCHISAPRGSKTGTQGLSNAKTRSQVPYELGEELLKHINGLIG